MTDRHITIGDLSLRLSIVADALGIPAATLERLAIGEWVAVPREPADRYRAALAARYEARQHGIDSPQMIGATEAVIGSRHAVLAAMLAAATEAGSHDY